ncbi:uncharacterized protein N7484_006355 [Penicillium longicatenatum]|uniref:uncharacterized protein n=1 Tax=Penicillium longicatenatum TaxID=1561947 RepID=UPI00254961D6|nr:uncharacterized protein N7484_006355 [Penicillium longicatenatum]KAJ5643848.1 hypothetical protein N7484_006355 [Penicillium longicatenatum]
MRDDQRSHTHADYTVGWICALPKTELVAATAMLDEEHPVLLAGGPHDTNSYHCGRIGNHNIVISCLPSEQTGKVSAANVAKDMIRSFPAIRFGLMVGIGGGAPYYGLQEQNSGFTTDFKEFNENIDDDEEEGIQDIRLGDVVVSLHSKSSEAVVQYDFGKSVHENGFIRAGGQLQKPPNIVLGAISQLQGQHERKGRSRIPELLSEMHCGNPGMGKFRYPGAENDQLFKASVAHHEGKKCEGCKGPHDINLVRRKKRASDDPQIHYGTIGSADQVMKDAMLRDKWSQQERIICFEMEAAGLMDSFPCLVVRGICDYADSHKNKFWQPYAAAVAAAYAKELLLAIPAQCVIELPSLEKFSDHVIGQLETWRRSDEEERCIQAFRTSDYEHSKNLNADREKKTCNWCLGNRTFQNWQSDSGSCLLWLTANPGCGKSVLAKALVDEQLLGLEPSDTTICYFFFKDTSYAARSPVSAMAALLHQLLVSRAGRMAMKHVLRLFRENGQKSPENMDVMWNIMKSIALDTQRGRIVLILDALDECEEAERKNFIKRLTALERDLQTGDLTCNFKILITSRPYWSIETEFRDLIQSIPGIRLKGESHSKELHKEMNHVMRTQISKLGPQFASEAAREELERGILATENRTYLWLHLTFKRLAELPRIDKETVRAELRRLPKTIDDIYESILLKSTDKLQTKKLLQIILAAVRPLRVEEIGVALFITKATKTYRDLEVQSGDQLELSIRNAGGLFVHIVDGVVLLIHQSAKDFLLMQNRENAPANDTWKSSLSMPESNSILASVCVRYLQLEEFQQRSFFQKHDASRLIVDYLFLEYAACNWTIHFQESSTEDSDELFPSASSLFAVDRTGYMGWVSIALSPRCFPVCSRLQIASFLGVESILRRELSDSMVDINYGGISEASPLHFAVLGLKLRIVQLLLSYRDVDVNKADVHSLTPLRLAVMGGNPDIVESLLCAPGIDVNKPDAHKLTPLRFAILGGHLEITRMLLGAPGIDVNHVDGLGHTPLRSAIIGNNLEIIRTLLWIPGMDPNKVDGFGYTPLGSAIAGVKLAVIEVLLGAPSIDVNQVDAHGLAPLVPVASPVQPASSMLPREFRRIRTGESMEFDTPALRNLVSESSVEWPKILALLLKAPGIDVNIADDKGLTPLHRAVRAESKEVVSMLLAAPNIDVNAVDKLGRTALSLALRARDREILDLILSCPGVNTSGRPKRDHIEISTSVLM